ncbi:MAG: radical SAM protein [Candidatus Omnitrophota bacterium]
MFEASYIKLHESGQLQKIADRLYAIYDKCALCPRQCGANRNNGEIGMCSAGIRVKVSSVYPHFGEEETLVGKYGSGSIFLTHCNLLCVYCQNWDISHGGEGNELADEQLADQMIQLQKMRCHNINVVTPTHFLPNIVQALVFAAERGLNIPLVYNSSGYERVEILQMINGIFDIYLPDYKYSAPETAAVYSQGATDYPRLAKAALREMHRQVGVLRTDMNQIAQRGLMIRHLLLPNNLAGTTELIDFIFNELDPATYVNIMSQYRPTYKAHQHPEISKTISNTEYMKAIVAAREKGLINLH